MSARTFDPVRAGCRWTPPRIARRSREVAAGEGLRSLLLRLLGETVYRRMTAVAWRYDWPLPVALPQLELVYGRLAPEDVDAYLALRPDEERASVVQRLGRGEECFVARRAGVVVGACWAAPDEARVDHLGIQLRLPPGHDYLYALYVAPRARRPNVSRALIRFVLAERAAAGRSGAFALCNPENGVQRLCARLGFAELGTVGVLRLGRWRRLRVRSSSRRRLPPAPGSRSSSSAASRP